MIKTLTNLFKQDKEKFVVPKGVQDVIPVAAIFDDGIFKVGKDKYSKTYRFTDINYAVASREDKESRRMWIPIIALSAMTFLIWVNSLCRLVCLLSLTLS